MRVEKKERKMRRTQISLPAEELEAVQKVAAKRHISMSCLVREALKKELEAESVDDQQMLSIIGLGEGSYSDGSEQHDNLIYG